MQKRRDIGRERAVILHLQSVRRIVIVDSSPVVQKTSYPSAFDQTRGVYYPSRADVCERTECC
jgi:hypothetical protein